MPKHIIIVYNPGYAGNFLQRLFSLGNEVVPQIPLNYLGIDSLDINRLELYSFKDVRSSFLNWQKFHRAWPTFYDYEKLKLKFFDNQDYTHVVFAMHFPEYEIFINDLNQISDIEYYYVDLDLSKYQKWINLSQKDLNYRYRLDEAERYDSLRSNSKFKRIDLTSMLDSKPLFEMEYIHLCELMNLTVRLEDAVKLYDDWFDVRVRYYLN